MQSNQRQTPSTLQLTRACAFAAIGAFLFVFSNSGSASPPGDAGGLIQASYQTSPTGAAIFTVPIHAAPGVQGLQPNLSLVYSSQNQGNGQVGVGWSLLGLSAISRCPRTIPLEDLPGEISYTRQDRLCLDGSRLVSRDSNHGNHIYWTKALRKEIEDWSETRGTGGTCGNAPCKFEVSTPNGGKMIYGGTQDSRVKTVRAIHGDYQTRQWLLSEVRDRNGNAMYFRYASGGAHSKILERIDYHGRSIRFEYDHRGDVRDQVIFYDGTGKTVLNKRLRSVHSHTAQSGEFKKLALAYDNSPFTRQSRVRRIDECDASGRCLDPIRLTWNDPGAADGRFRIVLPDQQAQRAMRFEDGAQIIPGDFNGDGRTDFIRQEKGDWDNDGIHNFQVRFSNGDGSFQVVEPQGHDYQNSMRYDNGAKIITGDFDGDGKTDFIRHERGRWSFDQRHNFQVYFSKGDGYFNVIEPQGNAYQGALRQDGFAIGEQLWVTGGAKIITGDYNGDGMTDFIRQEKGGWDDDGIRNFMVYLSQGDGYFDIITPHGDHYQHSLRHDPGVHIITGDYNGDGKTDFIRQEHSGWDDDDRYTFRVYFSRGDGYFDLIKPERPEYQHALRYDPGAKIIPGDYNGDGKTDFIRQERGGWSNDDHGNFNVYYSRGDGWFDVASPREPEYQHALRRNGGAQIIPGDYDGDGMTDFIRQETGDWSRDDITNFHLYFAARQNGQEPRNTIATIEQGSIRHTISYRRLSRYDANGKNGTISISDVEYSNGHRPYAGPLPVVREYRRSLATLDANGATTQSILRRYTYRGATAHPHRGFVGFQRSYMTAPEENLHVVADYHTRFPLSGRVAKKTTKTADGNTRLAEDVFEYQHRSSGTAAGGVSVRLKRRQTTQFLGSASQTTATQITHDNLDNPILVAESDGGRTVYTCSAFANDQAGKRPGPIQSLMRSTDCSVSGNSCDCSSKLSHTQYERDSRGNLTAQLDYDDSKDAWLQVEYAYDSRGNRIRETKATGAVETIAYDSVYHTYPDQITMQADGRSYTVRRRYDPRYGALTEETDANGNLSRREYDDFGRVLSVARTAPDGGTTTTETHSYSREGGLYLQTSQTRVAWDSSNFVRGKRWLDGFGRQLKEEIGSGTKRTVAQIVYDARGLERRRSKPHRPGSAAVWTIHEYNAQGRLRRVVQPGGATTELSYSYGGECSAHELRIAARTTGGSTRDAVRCQTPRQLTTKLILKDAANQSAATHTYSYDALDRLVILSDGATATTFTLDSLDRKQRVVNSDRGTIDYSYASDGRLSAKVHSGQQTVYQIDALGREREIVYHDGSRSVFEYDDATFTNARTRLTRAIFYSAGGDEKSRREYSYDSSGRVRGANLILNGGSGGSHALEYRSNPNGAPASVHYPSGRAVCYEYDAGGLLSEIRSPSGGDCAESGGEVFASYSDYTANAQPGRIAYGNGVVTEFEYDAISRVKHVRTLDANDAAILDQEYSWTPLHEIAAIDDRAGDEDASYTYNALGYLTRAVGPYGQIDYEYGANGNLTRKGDLTLQYQGNRPIGNDAGLALDYDATGNVIRRTGGDGNLLEYSYNGFGKIDQVAKNGAVAGRYEYDAGGERLRKIDGSANETLYVARELEITRFADGGEALVTEYVNSPGGRIAALSKRQASGTALLQQNSAGHALQARMYNTASIAGLVGFLNHTSAAYLKSPAAAHARSRIVSLLWSAFSLFVLIACVLHALQTAHHRSRLGRRWLRWPAPLLVMSMLSMSMHCGQNGGGAKAWIPPGQSGAFAFNFLLGPGGNGYGYPEEGVHYFHYNQVGSTSLVTNAAGERIAHAVYKPYGEIHQDASDGRDVFRGKFNEKEWDRDIEAYYFNARYYDPALGRFLQADTFTLGTSAESAAELNRYAFAANNPITYSDPSGNFALMTAFLVGVAIGATAGGIAYGVSVATDPNKEFSVGGFFKAVGIGAFAGAVAAGVAVGTVAGLAFVGVTAKIGTTAAGVISGIVAGGTEGFVASSLQQYADNGSVDWREVGVSVGIGGAAGVFGGAGLGKAAERTFRGAKHADLPPGIGKTFGRRHGVVKRVLTEETSFVRVYGGTAKEVGPYLSTQTVAAGSKRSIGRKLALLPGWGNQISQTVTVTLPKGTTIFEGVAGPQFQWRRLVYRGGGGKQIFVPFKDFDTMKGLKSWDGFSPTLQ